MRPCAHTRKSVEPGLYSHRTTVFDRNCLKLNPPGSPCAVYAVYRSRYSSARGFASSRQFEYLPLVMNGEAYSCSDSVGVAVKSRRVVSDVSVWSSCANV